MKQRQAADHSRSRWLLSDEARPEIEIPSAHRPAPRHFRLPAPVRGAGGHGAERKQRVQAARREARMIRWAALGESLSMQTGPSAATDTARRAPAAPASRPPPTRLASPLRKSLLLAVALIAAAALVATLPVLAR